MEVNDQLIDLLKRENDERLICLVIQSIAILLQTISDWVLIIEY